MTADEILEQVQRACHALPEVEERLSHGSPAFFVRGKRGFVHFIDHHHGREDVGTGIWCAAPPGVQEQLIREEPHRFYRPPYVGSRGWVGLRLDIDPDWSELADIVADAYCCVAPKTLAAKVRPSSV